VFFTSCRRRGNFWLSADAVAVYRRQLVNWK
jgi:hypothetical protein